MQGAGNWKLVLENMLKIRHQISWTSIKPPSKNHHAISCTHQMTKYLGMSPQNISSMTYWLKLSDLPENTIINTTVFENKHHSEFINHQNSWSYQTWVLHTYNSFLIKMYIYWQLFQIPKYLGTFSFREHWINFAVPPKRMQA